jgi:hypothetical protein
MKMCLFGAGASVEAEVPSANQMTSKILRMIRSNRQMEKHGHALSFVIGGLLFDLGVKNKNPIDSSVNIEDLFNAVQLLANRKTLEAAPFIGSWHGFVDELDKIYPRRPSGSLQKIIYETISKELSKAFSERLSSHAFSQIDRNLQSAIKKMIEDKLKNKTPSLSSGDGIGDSIEKALDELAKKWVNKILHPSSSFSSAVDKQIDKTITASQAISGEGKVFEEINSYMIAALKDLVWISDPNKVSYLAPILNIPSNQETLIIATLNYDNSVETLAKSYGFPLETGMLEWSKSGRLDFGESRINLLKLHGSIDWKIEVQRRSLKTNRIVKLEHNQVSESNLMPAVIFGGKNKLTADGPYLDLLKEFSSRLNASNELYVVGYSFRDPHINVYLSNWINASSENILTIVNGPDFLTEVQALDDDEYCKQLYWYASTHPHQIKFVQSYAGDGLRQLFNEFNGDLNNENAVIEKTAFTKLIETIDAEQNDNDLSSSEQIIDAGQPN